MWVCCAISQPNADANDGDLTLQVQRLAGQLVKKWRESAAKETAAAAAAAASSS